MRVLSLTEPYATLIKENKKRIETRSWKTHYRGELYIHASATKIPKEWKENKELMKLTEKTALNFGNIICKCNLVDCICMTKEYIEDIKNNNYQEYICGDYKEGRYAWILENITPLKMPIKAKGQLNIWKYYDDMEMMNLMNNIKYGWIDNHSKKHLVLDKSFSNHYVLQSPNQVIINQVGLCLDQVELERYYFKGNDWNIKTYFLIYYNGNTYPPIHTFLTFEKNDKFYWFEHAWERFRGINEYNTKKELLLDVRDKFIKYELNSQYENTNLVLGEYKKPKYHMTIQEFYHHCKNGKYIDFNIL